MPFVHASIHSGVFQAGRAGEKDRRRYKKKTRSLGSSSENSQTSREVQFENKDNSV